jgi:hypothetical protein
MSNFSKRNGYHSLNETEITIREDAPHDLRGVLVQLAYRAGYSPSRLRTLVCHVLKTRPSKDNWSEYPNINDENQRLLDGCDWPLVYDVIESIANNAEESLKKQFEAEINEYFVEKSIGWKLENSLIEIQHGWTTNQLAITFRGPQTLERSLVEAGNALIEAKLPTAASELHEAVSDLSRRPKPDLTGAIQHAMASLECVARSACNNEKATLGDVIKRHKDLLPKPLDEAIQKLWGFASENARHLCEGREPTHADAELVVSVAAATGNYLARKSLT